MNELYEFLDFLGENSISYRRIPVQPSGDTDEIARFNEQRDSDESSMDAEDFIEKYTDEIPMLNGTDDIVVFEARLNNGLRTFRDSISTWKSIPKIVQKF